MTHALVIIAALSITGGSITPQEAKLRTAMASQKEAAKICAAIEKEMGEHYTGGSFSTTFDAVHPFTAHYVGQHFRDHWLIRWNDWSVDDKWPHDTRIDRGIWANPRVVDGKEWKIGLSPKQ